MTSLQNILSQIQPLVDGPALFCGEEVDVPNLSLFDIDRYVDGCLSVENEGMPGQELIIFLATQEATNMAACADSGGHIDPDTRLMVYFAEIEYALG